MGFKVGRVFALDFTGTDLEGATVKLRSATVGVLQETVDTDTSVEREAEIFAAHIVSWDLEYDEDAYPGLGGQPVPTTKEGVLSLEEPLKNILIKEWWRATRGISAPLDHRSSDGQPSPGEENEAPLMSMETL